jgi:hypothetical protein
VQEGLPLDLVKRDQVLGGEGVKRLLDVGGAPVVLEELTGNPLRFGRTVAVVVGEEGQEEVHETGRVGKVDRGTFENGAGDEGADTRHG